LSSSGFNYSFEFKVKRLPIHSGKLNELKVCGGLLNCALGLNDCQVPRLVTYLHIDSFSVSTLLTGCKFSVTKELLVLAKVAGNSGIREWGVQKNAEDSGAQPDTKWR